jgi:hypothetical protein
MRRVFSSVFFCAFLLLLQTSCSVSLRDAVVGRYHGDADLSKLDPKLMPYAKDAMTALQGSLLEVKSNGKAKLSGLGNSFSGTWRLEGNRLILTPEKGERNQEFEVLDGAKKLVPIFKEDEDKFLGGAKIWFKKE